MFVVLRGAGRGISASFRGNFNVMQIANLTGRMTRGGPLKLKKPFPYRERYLTEIEALWDVTVKRVEEENAKLIVVEGPIASGKSAFMKLLAEEFDLLWMEQPTMDELYLTRTGFDLRSFDDQLPESVRTYDHKNFCLCPNDPRAVYFQMTMYMLRFGRYIDALTHILNTGQGVIMERSPYSDIVFVEAMYSHGYINENFRKYYKKVQAIADPLILKPHVIIYLDVPVKKVQERIKQRNLSYEVNSTALTQSYLEKLEDLWKNKYLDEASHQSEVLVYDWSEGGDIDIVIEDLEKLNLDPLLQEEYGLFSDWKTWRANWRELRRSYTNDKDSLMQCVNLAEIDVPEVLVPTEDILERNRLYATAPGFEYAVGFNPKAGDSLFRTLFGIPSKRDRTSLHFFNVHSL